ncbi:hypothetical protein [Sphingomonas prati]|uniref:Uncharacterized protein n=1 Tax=Sphingomonas prati TaxID=1843237 RepID=A0A7W9F2K5_9SPHN|nr:hypothetical protein [Sphingomonas prati]MBB5730411.1 hypothetical protein [Sphingomonas prati]GGE93861.1 hypothetical protein GCM10011404_28630 [Sphingomonas prati]
MRFILGFVLLLGVASTPVFGQTPVVSANATNNEMTAIFDADQAARKVAKIDWRVVGEADRSRRVRTQAMLDAGQLRSADDYYHAAFVFQHGDLPDDYLKAHALAIVAAARGKSEAAWIAAATLDRYLQHIGQPQIYGTQFLRHGDGDWTQEPYRRDLLSDPLREATGVPPIAKQGERLKEMAASVSKDR